MCAKFVCCLTVVSKKGGRYKHTHRQTDKGICRGGKVGRGGREGRGARVGRDVGRRRGKEGRASGTVGHQLGVTSSNVELRNYVIYITS